MSYVSSYQNNQGSRNSGSNYPNSSNGYKNNYQNNHKNNYEKLSTHIRNLYSKGMAILTLSFFKNNFSLLMRPSIETSSPNGLDEFNKEGIMTTISYDGASALWLTCHKIIFDSDESVVLKLQCANKVTLILEKKAPGEVYLVVIKNDRTIVFRFTSTVRNVTENGATRTEIIENGLGVFMFTLEGYLQGVNADAHFAKLGEEFEPKQE